ncbi:recombinase family protein [Saccharothrix violaceirubra]|uniref:DNA invertase Pin-like site-specific DNA recombinase n=1 Tax=Saccharothrix violaceirubra TaxID=413306 RepID=A0A7W7T9Q9_9PSEU|nr:recombinase family protein [Saccharothrix violaceirubra]MBB4968637.1 DNA invertase Pin-like site-specific DNA recombinase [Saccharothrix violaceirubra]
MATSRPRRAGGRTQLDIVPDQLIWALYGRDSLDPKGTAVRVTNQLAELRPFALGIGGRIGEEYPENNVSAFKRVKVMLPDETYGYRVVRPDWDSMMTALRRGEYNALALPNIDRGMRDPRDLEDLIDLVEQYGVYVVGMTGTIDLTTDEGISSARREVDQRNRESRNTSRRMADGNRKAAMAGKQHGGANRPFGWRKDRTTISKREAAHILREIPRLLGGVHPRTIAIEWGERGIPTIAGGKWRMMTIRQIFTNPRLCGWRAYLGEVLRDEHDNPVQGQWEPIITVEQHLALVAKLIPSDSPELPKRGRGHVTRRLLSPFARCGMCNSKMTGGSRKEKKTGERIPIYKCPPPGFGGCGRVSRTCAPIDRYITALVLAEQSRIQLGRADELPPWGREAELKAVTDQIKESTTAYKKKLISGGRYFPLMASLEADESKLRAEKRKYEAKRQARVSRAANLEAEWSRPDFTLEQKQAAIARSLTAVIIHPAPHPGARFTPDQITPVWREDDE